MNVDWPRTRLSDAPTRVNRRSTTPIRARRHGTNEPICASTTQRPTWLSSLHPRNRVGDPAPELIEDRRFARGNALFGAKHLRLVLFQLGRDVALRTGERLAPLVVGRDAVAMGVGDFDVVAEDLVKAHLERR